MSKPWLTTTLPGQQSGDRWRVISYLEPVNNGTTGTMIIGTDVSSVYTTIQQLTGVDVVVSVVIFVFLLHVRSALIPILTLPIGVLLAFVPMVEQHLTANIMSLGGIAVAIGAMVDASIIIIENIHKHLAEQEREQRRTRTAA